MIKIILFTLAFMTMSACTPPDNTLPTVAQLPTLAPTDLPVNADPTPTRESDANALPTIPAIPPSDLGSGAIGGGANLPELAGDGFAVRVSGAISETWTNTGAARCTSQNFILETQNARLIITLPAMARAGLFDMSATVGTQQASALYRAPNGNAYDQGVNGVLVLTSLNLSDGGRIQGSFDFSASHITGSVNLSGQFDMPASVALDCAG